MQYGVQSGRISTPVRHLANSSAPLRAICSHRGSLMAVLDHVGFTRKSADP